MAPAARRRWLRITAAADAALQILAVLIILFVIGVAFILCITPALPLIISPPEKQAGAAPTGPDSSQTPHAPDTLRAGQRRRAVK